LCCRVCSCKHMYVTTPLPPLPSFLLPAPVTRCQCTELPFTSLRLRMEQTKENFLLRKRTDSWCVCACVRACERKYVLILGECGMWKRYASLHTYSHSDQRPHRLFLVCCVAAHCSVWLQYFSCCVVCLEVPGSSPTGAHSATSGVHVTQVGF